MILNQDKCYYMFLRSLLQNNHTGLCCIEIESSKNKTLLGVNFYAHIKFLCSKVALKLSALSRINKYLSYNQKLLFVNSVLKGHLPIVL